MLLFLNINIVNDDKNYKVMHNIKNKKMFVENKKRFQILTDSGFSDFIGITKTCGEHDGIEIKTKDGVSIKTTVDHKIYCGDMSYKTAGEFEVGDTLRSDSTNVDQIVESVDKCLLNDVYDILHVYKGNRYFISNAECKSLNILVFNCLYIDEIAFINNVEVFYDSVFPTISSSDKTKVIVTSTPLGLNFFYKMWTEAENGESAYVPYDVKWYEHPERDQAWYDTMCKTMNPTAIDQEMNCVSGDTNITIDGHKYTIESLYNKLNNNTSMVAYVNDINISVEK